MELIELKEEIRDINGGNVAGFIVGYFLGSCVAFVATPVIAANGGTQEECSQVFLSCVTIGGALGAVAPL